MNIVSQELKNIPKISIITAVKDIIKENRQAELIQAFDSIHTQTYKNFEHIVIDGSSTDKTCELLDELSKQYNFIYISEQDNSLYDAMNKGICLAKGDYIAFLNSDDYYASNNIFQIVSDACMQFDSDFIYGYAHKFNDQKNYIDKPDIAKVFSCTPFCHQSTFCKKECFKKYGYFSGSYKILADHDFILNAFLSGASFVKLNEIIVFYKLGGFSHSNPSECSTDINQIKINYNIPKSNIKILKNLSFLLKNRPKDEYKYFFIYYLRQTFKDLRRWCITLHLKSGKRYIKLFGIIFYKEKL